MILSSSYILGRTIASDPINLAHVFATAAGDAFFMVFAAGLVLAVQSSELR